MPPTLALLIGFAIAGYALFTDQRRAAVKVTEVLWPTLWYMVVSSHVFGYWAETFGIPLPSGSDDPTEGSAVDRYFFLVLIVLGFRLLRRRNFKWGELMRYNPWLTALLAFMAMSILWSDYSFVSFKRYIKVVGSVTMALVILTNERPIEALFAVLRRCLYIHLPMSLVCIKYYRDIGVAYDWSGTGMWWQGISTTKNTFAQVTMIAAIYFVFELMRNWPRHGVKTLFFPYLLLSFYLLKGGSGEMSMTSVSVCAFALGVMLLVLSLRQRVSTARAAIYAIFAGTIVLLTVILIHSVNNFSTDSIFGHIITSFGRDITLTDRTFIWADVYKAVGNPLIGVGYGGFWIGRIANIQWAANLTWILGQAHSGYIDTYLQIGLIGGFLFAGMIFSSIGRLTAMLGEDFDGATFRITLFLTTLFVNITESTFLRGDHHLWMIFMTAVWIVPKSALPAPVWHAPEGLPPKTDPEPFSGSRV